MTDYRIRYNEDTHEVLCGIEKNGKLDFDTVTTWEGVTLNPEELEELYNETIERLYTLINKGVRA